MGVRALYCVVNVGHEADSPDARGLYVVWNVAHEAQVVVKRGLYAVWNVGTYAMLLARALYAVWAVSLRTGGDDPLEMQLVKANLINIERILRGK